MCVRSPFLGNPLLNSLKVCSVTLTAHTSFFFFCCPLSYDLFFLILHTSLHLPYLPSAFLFTKRTNWVLVCQVTFRFKAWASNWHGCLTQVFPRSEILGMQTLLEWFLLILKGLSFPIRCGNKELDTFNLIKIMLFKLLWSHEKE